MVKRYAVKRTVTPTRKKPKGQSNDHRKLTPSKAELKKGLLDAMQSKNADGSRPMGSG